MVIGKKSGELHRVNTRDRNGGQHSENYQGGDFLYWLDNKEYKMNRNRGYGAMLSADIEHEVLKVTEGVRHSFVVFIKLNDLENIKSKKIF